MTDYSEWPVEPCETNKLLLDAWNPRIPYELQGKLNQEQIINYLSDNEDIIGIAENIAHINYFTFEPLIGYKEKENVIILEGNRRLCACKLLINNGLAPAKLVNHYKELSKKINRESVEVRNVLIAPSRQTASGLIANRHINNLLRKWDPVMQACHFHSLLTPSKTVEGLSNELLMPESEVRREIQSFNVYLHIQNLPFESNVDSKVKDTHRFPLSTLRRIYESPAGKKFLKIRQLYSKNNQFEYTIDYSLINGTAGKEVMIYSNNLSIPHSADIFH